jgi:hypothetical protein
MPSMTPRISVIVVAASTIIVADQGSGMDPKTVTALADLEQHLDEAANGPRY